MTIENMRRISLSPHPDPLVPWTRICTSIRGQAQRLEGRFSLIFLSVILFLLAYRPAVIAEIRMKMATTTSVENSGLLDVLLPPFEEKFNVKVDIISAGTGKALELGKNGDVDVVFVHSPSAEDKFIEDGYGVNRRDVMYNDFVLVGSEEDSVGVKGKDVIIAFKIIAEEGFVFISRGDESGTHNKEKELWKQAGIKPQGKWYMESGQGMGATLLIADDKEAYCLVDRGTFIAYEDKIDLVILCEKDDRLFNPYSIIAVSPERHPHVNYVHVMSLIGWITSKEAQETIGKFKRNERLLFYPGAYRQ